MKSISPVGRKQCLTMLNLSIYECGMPFNLDDTEFSLCFVFFLHALAIHSVRFVSKYFIFGAIINDI